MKRKTNNREDCRLCKLVDKISGPSAGCEPWEDHLAIEDSDGKLHEIIIRGIKYRFADGTSEIVRGVWKNTLFVNPIKDYSSYYSDIVIAIPRQHWNNEQFMTEHPAELGLFMRDVYLFSKREYGEIGERMMINDEKFASQKEHLHAQIQEVKGTEGIIPSMRPLKVSNYIGR